MVFRAPIPYPARPIIPGAAVSVRPGAWLAVAVLLFAGPLPLSAQFGGPKSPSASYIVVDTTYKKILASGNADQKLPIGGLAQIASACVITDWLDATNGDRSRVMIVPPSPASITVGNPLGLRPGDQISIRDALFSCLMTGDNVAILTLAEVVGNEMWARSGVKANSALDFFVAQMNALAVAQGMTQTKFVNPHGIDSTKSRDRGFSTATDLAKISIYAIRKPSFNFFVGQREREVSFSRNGQQFAYRIFNTNTLLGSFGVTGVKTARNSLAGECLVVSSKRQDKITHLPNDAYLRIPYQLVVVILNSQDRFGHARQLIQEGFASYDTWINGDRILPRDQMLQMPE